MTELNGVAERNGLTEQLTDLERIRNQFGSLVDSYVEAFSDGLEQVNQTFADHLNYISTFKAELNHSKLPKTERAPASSPAAGDDSATPPKKSKKRKKPVDTSDGSTSDAGSGGGGKPPKKSKPKDADGKLHYEIEGKGLEVLEEAPRTLDKASESFYTRLTKVMQSASLTVKENADIQLDIEKKKESLLNSMQDRLVATQTAAANKYAEILAASQSTRETAQLRFDQRQAETEIKVLEELEKRKEEARQLAYETSIINGEELTVASMQAIEEEIEKRYNSETELAAIRAEVLDNERALIEQKREDAEKEEKEAAKKKKEDERDSKRKEAEEKKQRAAQGHKVATSVFNPNSGMSLKERKDAMSDLLKNADGTDKSKKEQAGVMALAMANAMSDLVKSLENKMDAVGKYQAPIDTRLNGSTVNEKNWSGSYWSKLQSDIMSIGGFSPYFTQEDFSNNIKTLVDKGIAFDLKQRAFLMTIQEKIATTFEVADGTLLRLVRIQQADTTAGRMGMEVALNAFLNNMHENTEYLKDVATSVRGSLEEMSALMSGENATEVEFQTQKWLGSLYSAGMSREGVNAIAQTFGSLASGDVEALSGGAGNLLVMAAQNSGISLTDIMASGINAQNTNELFSALTGYLIQTAENTKDNQVVMQQMAKVFGLKASDLKAAENLKLTGAYEGTKNYNQNYDTMLTELFSMANTMHKRTSLSEMMGNAWNNAQFSLASSVAKNPVTYGLAKAATLLEDLTGGIDIPFLNVMGFGVDLNTSVAQLMRVGALTGGILGSIGDMVSGLGNMFAPGGRMLTTAGIEKSGATALKIESRGSGLGGGSGESMSESGTMVANSNGQEMADSTMAAAEKDKEDQLIEAKDEMEDNEVTALNTYVLSIYKILDQVVSGESQFHVKLTSGLGTDGLYGTGGGWGVILNK